MATYKDFFNMLYPIGTIYQSVSSTNPGTIMGGTWEAWGKGRVPVGVDAGQTEFDVVEETGGAKTHTLQLTEIPNHAHAVWSGTTAGSNYYKAYTAGGTTDSVSGAAIGSAAAVGGGGAHNNLQPYITCYFWKRTA